MTTTTKWGLVATIPPPQRRYDALRLPFGGGRAPLYLYLDAENPELSKA